MLNADDGENSNNNVEENDLPPSLPTTERLGKQLEPF